MAAVDLNADLGEGYGAWSLGDDEALLGTVTSANVACGFHAGDPSTIRRTCLSAARSSVRIGAQVSYPDLAGFGRRAMSIPFEELRDLVLYQLGTLDGFAQVAGTEVAYVKPHGALYHACWDDRVSARAVVEAAIEYDPSLVILGPAGSMLLAEAERIGLEQAEEVFADRAYTADGHLVPRSEPGAVLQDLESVVARVLRAVGEGEIEAVDGTVVRTAVRSICVHSDTPDAVGLARGVRSALEDAGIGVYPFC